MNATYDKILGCIVGGAAGDALGYPIEFDGEKTIFKEYGKDGIQRYNLRQGKALISDDTQMTLFTAAGLLLAGDTQNYTSFIENIIFAYRDWRETQEFKGAVYRKNKTWLAGLEEMNKNRAPGITCMQALDRRELGCIDEPINNSKGNGGVMRVAPIGLFYNEGELPLKEIDYRGAQAAALTHGHPMGYISAAGLVHIIYLLTHVPGMTIRKAAEDMLEKIPDIFPDAPGMCDAFCEIIQKAIELADGEMPDLDCIHKLGEGKVGEEALAISIFCCLRHEDDFDAMLRAAVNHGGDSDSTGAIAGNIMGAYIGFERIPKKYTEDLELMDVMQRISREMTESIEGRAQN